MLELVAYLRRRAVAQLVVGRLEEALSSLSSVPQRYVALLEDSGINLSHVHVLKPVMAAMKVLAAAMLQTGLADKILEAGKMLADVEETEAILAGYREGALEETRWELGEQRRAALSAPGAMELEAVSATKKSKAAKRKQQKRKAQQQKKAAEQAEAAAKSAARGGEGQGEDEKLSQQEQAEAHGQEQEQQEEQEALGEEEQEGPSQQAVTAVAAAFSAMAVSGTEGLEEEEEEEEDECSVCLNVIDSNDDDANPAGPALRCGHRYHAFCCSFGWRSVRASASSLPAPTVGRRCRTWGAFEM